MRFMFIERFPFAARNARNNTSVAVPKMTLPAIRTTISAF